MTTKQALQAAAADAQEHPGALDVPSRPRNLRGWRTVKELREELRFPSDEACRVWLKRQGIAGVKRGRVILVSGLDVERKLRGR